MLREIGPNCERLASGGDRQILLLTGSIETLHDHFDALVSSDDNYLSHGGGVSRKIWAAGKLEWLLRRTERPHLQLGDVFVSGPGGLNANHILHAVTIDFDTGQRIGRGNPSALVRSVLATAERVGCDSVAMPQLGTGAAGLDPENFIQSFATAGKTWARGPSSLKTLALVLLPEANGAITAKLKEEISSIEWAEDIISCLPTEFVDLGQRWIRSIHLQNEEDQSQLIMILEELCRRLSVSFDQLSAKQSESLNTTEIIETLRGVLDQETHSSLNDAWLIRNEQASNKVAVVDAVDKINHCILRLFRLASRSPSENSTSAADLISDISRNVTTRHRIATHYEILSEQVPGKVLPESIQRSSDVGWHPLQSHSAIPELVVESDTHIGEIRTSVPEPEVSTASLRALRTFVDQQFKGSKRSDFLQRLENDGYNGPDELKILEFLIREPDLLHWIANEFSWHILQRELIRRGVKTKSADCQILARQLLESFGFACPRRFKGIERVTLEMRNLSSELLIPQSDHDGCVTRAAKLLEYVCKMLVQFLTQAAFGEAPEVLLIRSEKLTPGSELALCTLGTLLEFVTYLVQRIEDDETTPSVQRFKSVLELRRSLPKDMNQLAAVRNSFVHYKQSSAGQPDNDRRKLARSFVRDALKLLDAVSSENAGLFPVVVRIDSVQIDRWSRRTISALRDDDSLEIIFTDRLLTPGRVYLMHPLSNPLRVDPILVDAGELWIED